MTGAARLNQLGEVGWAAGGLAVWLGGLIFMGWQTAIDTSWLLLMVVAWGGRTLLMRLRFSDASVEISVGPWRRRADLTHLGSITFEQSGLAGSQGTLFITDQSGDRVPIYVGRFNKSSEWAAVLLRAAASRGAQASDLARETLKAEVAATGADLGTVAGRPGTTPQDRGCGSE